MRRSIAPFFFGFAAGVAALAITLWWLGALHTSSVSAGRIVPVLDETPGQAAQPRARTAVSARGEEKPARITGPTATAVAASTLEPRGLIMPIAGLKLRDIQDTFNDTRGGSRKHEATDILSPRGTPVVAIDDGVVKKLFVSQRGGLTVYQFDRDQIYCYYYAHLDRYAEGLKEGMFLHRGDRIGYVGTTGDAAANTPHLHLAIFELGPEKRWWQGRPINPYPILMDIMQKSGAR